MVLNILRSVKSARSVSGGESTRNRGSRQDVRRGGAVVPLTRGAVGSGLGAISGRGHPHELSKYRSEIALVAKPHLLADVRNRFVCHGQQCLRPLDPAVIQIRHKGLAGGSLEEA